MQKIYYPTFTDECGSSSSGSYAPGTLQIINGGTGKDTAPTAAANLGLVTSASVNTTGGPIGLDSTGVYSGPVFNLSMFNNVTGPKSVVINSTTTYVIDDYDNFTTYHLTAISGTATLNTDSTLTYKAPATAGPGGFILNNSTKAITITAT